MLRSYWIAALALGLITLTTLGQAQEQADHSQRDAQQEQAQTLSPPLPVVIIEEQGTAEARERQEAEARQREIEDLIAQQGMDSSTRAMNEATQDMRDYALYSTIFVGVGTILLIVTLGLTYQANRAAFRAVEVTDSVGRLQVRAYVSFNETRVDAGINTETGDFVVVGFTPVIQNTGQSPAYVSGMYSFLLDSDGPCCPWVPFHAGEAVCENAVGANGTADMAKQRLDVGLATEVRNGTRWAYLLGWVEYQDVFQVGTRQKHVYRFCFELEFENAPAVLIDETTNRPFLRQNSKADFRIYAT